MFTAKNVTPDIFWVGALDYDIRTFDIVMHTEYGTTYNAYIVKGKDKIALIEIVKDAFFDEFMERVSQVVDPTKIDYVITSHTEPDHSGALAKFHEINPNAQIIGSASAIRFLKDITNKTQNTHIVKDGDTLDLGGKTLSFIMAPFLHWPDSMYTYCKEDKVLFTCDSFGSHYCSENIFNDEQPKDFMPAYQYYFDTIMGPFKPYVLSALAKIQNLPLSYICTGHGPILRTNIPTYIELYQKWATPKKAEKPNVVIAYVSAYGYTAKLAQEIAKGIESAGVLATLFDLVESTTHDATTAIALANGLLVGSPTLVGDTLPPIWHLLAELNPIVHKGLIAGAFGSYGWSGEAVPNICERLKQLKFKTPLEPLKVVFNPNQEELEKAYAFGKLFAEEVKK